MSRFTALFIAACVWSHPARAQDHSLIAIGNMMDDDTKTADAFLSASRSHSPPAAMGMQPVIGCSHDGVTVLANIEFSGFDSIHEIVKAIDAECKREHQQ